MNSSVLPFHLRQAPIVPVLSLVADVYDGTWASAKDEKIFYLYPESVTSLDGEYYREMLSNFFRYDNTVHLKILGMELFNG